MVVRSGAEAQALFRRIFSWWGAGHERGHQGTDFLVPGGRMAQMDLLVELVEIPAPRSVAAEITLIDEVGHDALDGSLGDPHLVRHVPQPDLGVSGDGQQDEPVVGNEGPRGAGWFLGSGSSSDGRDDTRGTLGVRNGAALTSRVS
jgi:hypothetical protein